MASRGYLLPYRTAQLWSMNCSTFRPALALAAFCLPHEPVTGCELPHPVPETPWHSGSPSAEGKCLRREWL